MMRLTLCFAMTLQSVSVASEIVLIIVHRLGNGFADGLEAREVDGAGNLMLCKDFFQQRLVAHIALDKLHCLASNFRHTFPGFQGWNF